MTNIYNLYDKRKTFEKYDIAVISQPSVFSRIEQI